MCVVAGGGDHVRLQVPHRGQEAAVLLRVRALLGQHELVVRSVLFCSVLAARDAVDASAASQLLINSFASQLLSPQASYLARKLVTR